MGNHAVGGKYATPFMLKELSTTIIILVEKVMKIKAAGTPLPTHLITIFIFENITL